jgi:hypothetical protein
VPEFKIDYTNTVKVTHTEPYPSIDPYTGKTVYVGGGTSEYKVRQILIVITNQPFTPYVDKATYKQVGLFYSVQIKGHYAQNWATIEYWIKEAPAYNPRIPYQEQDYSSEYTTLRIANDFPDEGELDFRVQALEGWPVTHSTSDHIDLHNMFASFSFNGTASDWSSTQTITLHAPTSSTDDHPSVSPSPTVPELPFVAVFSLLIFLPLSMLIIKCVWKK